MFDFIHPTIWFGSIETREKSSLKANLSDKVRSHIRQNFKHFKITRCSKNLVPDLQNVRITLLETMTTNNTKLSEADHEKGDADVREMCECGG